VQARLADAARALRKASRPSQRETARVLEERARVLARPLTAAEPVGAVLDVVTFMLDGERMAMDVQYVRAVGRTPELTPLPAASDALLGVASFRGEIVAVFDVAASGAGRVRSQALFLGRAAIEMAIVADAIEEVAHLPARAVVIQPWRAPGGASGGRRGLTADGLSVIDAAALLADEQFMVGPPGAASESGGR
jgi:purine-binding chemotaxis protein CheW